MTKSEALVGSFKNCLSKQKVSEPAITWNALTGQLKISCTPEPAIQPYNTGQPVSYFGSCLFIIT